MLNYKNEIFRSWSAAIDYWWRHLYPVLRQLRFHGEHLARIHIGVVRLVEGLLELLQLVWREHSPAEPEPEHEPEHTRKQPNTERGGFILFYLNSKLILFIYFVYFISVQSFTFDLCHRLNPNLSRDTTCW